MFSSLLCIYLNMNEDAFGSHTHTKEPMISDERVTLDSSDQKSCLLTTLLQSSRLPQSHGWGIHTANEFHKVFLSSEARGTQHCCSLFNSVGSCSFLTPAAISCPSPKSAPNRTTAHNFQFNFQQHPPHSAGRSSTAAALKYRAGVICAYEKQGYR